MQTSVLVISLLIMSLIAAVFMHAARAASAPSATPPSEQGRKRLIWGLLIAGAVISVVSLARWPHA